MTPIEPMIVKPRDEARRVTVYVFFAGLACGLLLTGALDRNATAVEVTRPAPAVIPGALLQIGQHLCGDNRGLAAVESLGRDRYTFHCRDGAQWPDIEATLKDERGEKREERGGAS